MPDKNKTTTLPKSEYDALFADDSTPSADIDLGNFKEEIGAHESDGDYSAENDTSSAKGKYQFLWTAYGDRIRKETGVKNAKEFLNNPDAQDKFMDSYTQSDVIPWVQQQKESGNTRGLTDKQLGQLYHFIGPGGAEKYLTTGKYKVPGQNASIDDYLEEKVPRATLPASEYNSLFEDAPEDNPQKKSPSVTGLADSSQSGQNGSSQIEGLGKTDPITGLPVFGQAQGVTKVLPGPLPETQPLKTIDTEEAPQDWTNPTATISESPKDGVAVGVNGKIDTPLIPKPKQIPRTADDVKAQTADASDYMAKDIVDNMADLPPSYAQNANSIQFNQPGNIVHDITDPHGNPEMTAGYMKARLAQLQRDYNADREAAKQKMYNDPHPDPEALSKVDADYFKNVNDIKNNASHLVDLQLANKAYADKNFDAVKLGIDQQKLLGNPKATQDEVNYNNKRPLDPNAKFAYQSIGLNILQKGKENTAANDQEAVASQFGEHSDDANKILKKDNPEVYRNNNIQQIANQVYKDENPIHGTLFSRENITQEELEAAAKKVGLSKSDIADIKPEDVPRSAGLINQAAQGLVNTAGAPLYEGGMRALAGLGIANKDAVDKRFHPGWEEEGGFGSAFTGKTPQAQHELAIENPRGVLGAMANGAGSLFGFLAGGEAGGNILQAAGATTDLARANKIANFATAALPSYNGAYQRSETIIGDKPKDEVSRQAYSILNGVIGGAVMMIDPKADIARDVLGETKAGTDVVKMLKKGDVSELASQAGQQKLADVIAETGKHLGLQIAMPVAQTAAGNISDMLFDPKGNHHLSDNVGQSAISGAVGMFLPSLFAGIHAPMAQSGMNKSLLWDVGNNPTHYRDEVTKQYQSGNMSQPEYVQAVANIDKTADIVKNQVPPTNVITGAPLTEEQKQQYAWSLLRSKDLEQKEGQATKGGDKAQINLVNDQIKETDKERADILNEAGEPNTYNKKPFTPPQEQQNQAPDDERSVATDAQPAIDAYVTKITQEGKEKGQEEDYQRHIDNIKKDPESAINHELTYYNAALDHEQAKETPDKDIIADIKYHINEVQIIADKIAQEKNIAENKKEDISLTSDKEDNTSTTSKTKDHEKSNGQNGNANRQEDGTGQANAEDQRSNTEVRGDQENGRVQGQEESIRPTTADSKAGASEQPTPAISVGKKKRRSLIAEEEPIPVKEDSNLQTQDLGEVKGQDEEKTAAEVKEATIKHPDEPADIMVAEHPQGESFNEAKDRFKGAIDKIAKDAPDNTVVMTHSWGLKLLEAAEKKGWDHADLGAEHQKQSTETGDLIPYKTEDGRTIWFARHGETEDNVNGKQRTNDTPLTETGKQQAKDIATKLKDLGVKPSQIITSDLPRAKETSDIISKEFAEPEAAVKAPNKPHDETDTEKEKLKETPKPNGAIATEAVESNKGDATNLRLKQIEDNLRQQRASQQVEAKKREQAEKEKNIPEANKHNENWYKKQEKIDKLEEERSGILKDQEREEREAGIKKVYNDYADKLEKKYEANKKKNEGVALSSILGISTKVGDHVADFMVARAIEGIRELGNIHIAIDRAIRLAKEKFGTEAKELLRDDNRAIKEHLLGLGQKNPEIKEEPILPIDHEEYAKDILADIKSGDISYGDALKEVNGEVLLNREGKPASDHVQENNKAKILRYIDYHMQNDLTSIKNTTTRLRRQQFGLDEEIPAAHKEFGETWDEAKDKIESNPQAPQNLIAELSQKPRPLTDVENAIMLHQQNTKEIEYQELNNKINKAAEQGDQASLVEYKSSKARVLDELQQIYDINKAVGTENARGLASRRMMTDRKYSLVNMIAEKRATANDGQPLSEEQEKQIEELHQKIQETQTAFNDYVKGAESQIIDLQRKALQGKLKDKKGAADKLREWADKIEKASKNQAYSSPIPITPKMVAEGLRLVAAGIDRGEQIVDLVKSAITKIKDLNPEVDDLQLEKELNKSLIESGILEPTPERRKATDMGELFTNGKLDRGAVKLKTDADRAKAEYEINIKRDKQNQLSATAKAQNLFIKWQRAFKLSNPLTMAKLMSAGITRLVTTPLEDIVGGAYSTILPQLAKGAIGEGGGLNINETAKAYKRGLLLGMKDAKDIMSKKSHGKSELDVLFGKAGDLPPEAIDFFGQLHSATKAPIKRAIFERSLERRLRRNLANGADITDPMVQTSIMTDAYKDANRAIFMQDNKVAEGWQKLIKHFDQVDPKTGKANSKIIGSALQWLIPFVKVPTNIAAEIGTHAYGVPVAAAKLIHAAFTTGIENLPDDQKEVILRNLKKGSLGLAAMSLGYFNPQNFGGYYQPGQKRKEDDAEALGLKLWGVKVPATFVESPIFQAMQIGATVRRVKEEKVHGEENGIGEGLWAGVSGLAQSVPLASQPVRVAQLFGKSSERDYYLGELAKSTVDPALLTYLAKVTDPADEGSPIRKALAPENKRKTPKTIVDHIKSGLPFLREDLEEKNPTTLEGIERKMYGQ